MVGWDDDGWVQVCGWLLRMVLADQLDFCTARVFLVGDKAWCNFLLWGVDAWYNVHGLNRPF